MRSVKLMDGPGALETLEPRRLLSTDFAGVGLTWFQQGSVRADATISEGVVSDSLTVTGEFFESDSDGRSFEDDLQYDRITRLVDGRFVRDPNRGRYESPQETNGAQYLFGDGFPIGWWFAQHSGGQEIELLVSRATDASRRDLETTWRFGMLTVDYEDGEFRNVAGRLEITADDLEWDTTLGSLPRSRSDIDTYSQGRLVSTADEYIYLSSSGSVIIIADMADRDGIVSFGAGVRLETEATFQQMAGGYLLATAYAGAGSQILTGSSLGIRQRYLDLEEDGDYKIYDLDEWDDGRRDALERGFWDVDGSEIVLRESETGREQRLWIADGGDALVQHEVESGGVTAPAFAVATRATPATQRGPEPIFSVPADGRQGRPVVYELVPEDAWFVTDITLATGGPAITGDVVTWVDPKDGLTYAAAVTGSSLSLYRGALDGTWTLRNLVSESGQGEAIARGLRVMISPDNLVTITGLTASGELVRYYQDGATLQSGEFRFLFSNISDADLTPQGLSTPAWSGDLESFATSWGGLNVVGLDAQGTIWSVWWAPGLTAWTASDLTTLYGAEALTGGLTVYLTSWDGINIAGIGQDGNLKVTWWVPSLGGEWRQADLTAEAGGPRLTPQSVTSYVSTWDGLNIAGIDSATGKVAVYWWVPSRQAEGWATTLLSDAVEPTPDPIAAGTSSLQGVAGSDGSLNLFGYDGEGEFIRYYWRDGFGGTWRVQNLTQVATTR